jgi:hypothetical protein
LCDPSVLLHARLSPQAPPSSVTLVVLIALCLHHPFTPCPSALYIARLPPHNCGGALTDELPHAAGATDPPSQPLLRSAARNPPSPNPNFDRGAPPPPSALIYCLARWRRPHHHLTPPTPPPLLRRYRHFLLLQPPNLNRPLPLVQAAGGSHRIA